MMKMVTRNSGYSIPDFLKGKYINDFNPDERGWVSASNCSNYWAREKAHDHFRANNPKYPVNRYNTNCNIWYSKPVLSQTPYKINEQGIQFENMVNRWLRRELDSVWEPSNDMDIDEAIERAKKIIKKGKQDVLIKVPFRNGRNKTFGEMDIVIKGSTVIKLFPYMKDTIDEKYHNSYIVIDVKYHKIKLLKDGISIGSASEHWREKVKGQLSLYNKALNNIQDVKCPISLVLGSEYEHKKEKYDWDKRLGVVDFDNKDECIVNELPKAISWVRCCQQRKHIVSQYHSEEDPMWECRDEKHNFNKSYNVYDDEYKFYKTRELMDSPTMDMDTTIEWNGGSLEFYNDGNILFCDAETTGLSVFSTFYDYHFERIDRMIMWGIMDIQGNIEQLTSNKEDTNNISEEISECYTKRIGDDGKKLYIVHWGHAEKNYIDRYNIVLPNDVYLVDLHKIVKQNGLKIKGCSSYGLKDVMKSLYENNLIDFKYEGDVKSGSEAMSQLIHYYYNDGPESIIEDIKYYNKLDCEALRVLWNFLSKDYKNYM